MSILIRTLIRLGLLKDDRGYHSHLLDVSGVRYERLTYLLGASEWLFGHHHPLHAGWLGAIGWRIPCDGRKRRVPHEGFCSAGHIFLFAQAGSVESCLGCAREHIYRCIHNRRGPGLKAVYI